MKLIIVIIVLVFLGFLGSRKTFTKSKLSFGARQILLTGTEFIFVGFLLGEKVTNFLNPQILNDLKPLMSFGLGWVGMLFGVQFNLKKMRELPRQYFMMSMIQGFITFVIVFIVFFILLHVILGFDLFLSLLTSSIISATASGTAQPSLAIVHKDKDIQNQPFLRLLRTISSTDGVIGILAVGLLLCFLRPDSTSFPDIMVIFQWIGLSVFLGIAMSMIFNLLSIQKLTENELLLIIFGTLIFAGGIAHYLMLSPLFIGFTIGIVLANMLKVTERLFRVLREAEKTIYIILLVMAGASWNLNLDWIIVLSFVYIIVRLTGKVIGTYTATALNKPIYHVPKLAGLGLVAEGGLSLAILIDFQQTYHTNFTDYAFSIVLLAIIINELISPFFISNVVNFAEEKKL